MAEEINVEIANLATGFFGEDDQIREPNEDSKPARSVRAVWRKVRRFVLTKANWSHALRRQNLSARTASDEFPLIDFEYAFPLPADFVRLVKIIEPRAARDSYSLERGPKGREILTNYAGPLQIQYVSDVEDPALWSEEYTEVFAMRLAYQVADRLSGSARRKEDARVAYMKALRDAMGGDARQQAPREHGSTPWNEARSRSTTKAPNVA